MEILVHHPSCISVNEREIISKSKQGKATVSALGKYHVRILLSSFELNKDTFIVCVCVLYEGMLSKAN